MEGGVKPVHAVYPAHLKMHHRCANSVWGFPCTGWESEQQPTYWKCRAVDAGLAVRLVWVSWLMLEWGQISELAGFLVPSPKQIHVWTHRLPINYSPFPRREELLPVSRSHTPAWFSNRRSYRSYHTHARTHSERDCWRDIIVGWTHKSCSVSFYTGCIVGITIKMQPRLLGNSAHKKSSQDSHLGGRWYLARASR